MGDPAAMAHRIADWVARTAAAAVAARGACNLALAGGSTPRACYTLLATSEFVDLLDWSHVHVYFGDERAVPPDDPASNYGMAQATLLAHVPIPAAQVHRMEAERPDREAAAAEYELLLPPVLDLLLLGLGPDGHTASLFPGARALSERRRRVVVVKGPKPPQVRLTITPPVIAAARHVAVLAAGAEKAEAVARALARHADPKEVPAALASRGVWFLDRAAAARLGGPAA